MATSLEHDRAYLWLIAALLLALCATGCVPRGYAPPSARGTWTGYAEPTRVYDGQGNAFPATAIRIVEGPEVPKVPGRVVNEKAMREYEQQAPKIYHLLTDEQGRILDLPDIRAGERIRVRGAMLAGGYGIRGPQNQKVSQIKGRQPITEPAIRVSKVWKAPPDDAAPATRQSP